MSPIVVNCFSQFCQPLGNDCNQSEAKNNQQRTVITIYDQQVNSHAYKSEPITNGGGSQQQVGQWILHKQWPRNIQQSVFAND